VTELRPIESFPDALRRMRAAHLTLRKLGFDTMQLGVVLAPGKDTDKLACGLAVMEDNREDSVGNLHGVVPCGLTDASDEVLLGEQWFDLLDVWNAMDAFARFAEWKKWQGRDEVYALVRQLHENGIARGDLSKGATDLDDFWVRLSAVEI
jgi:hypothetical protein